MKDVELTECLKVGQATDALKEMRERDVWNVMIGYTKEQGT